LRPQTGKSFSNYDPDFLASGVKISPIKLSLRPGLQIADARIFDGSFRAFNDSLPDWWGRILLDCTLEQHGINRRELNTLDRLAYVGHDGIGALSYEPERGKHTGTKAPLALDKPAEESAFVLAGQNEEVFGELLRLNSSSACARSKIVAQVSADKKWVIHR
jgi:serine/threonine-protein kinase HipA